MKHAENALLICFIITRVRYAALGLLCIPAYCRGIFLLHLFAFSLQGIICIVLHPAVNDLFVKSLRIPALKKICLHLSWLAEAGPARHHI